MSCSWVEVTIDSIKSSNKNAIAMGPFGSRIKADNFVSSGVPILKGGNLHQAYINDSVCDFLTEEKADELMSSNATIGDIVITHRGTIGQVSIIPYNARFKRYVVSQSQLKISVDETKANPYYINYFLRSPLGQHRLLLNASQVGVPAIARATKSIKDIEIPLPPLFIQNKIENILTTLDNKINNNIKIKQTLEQIAQTLFKSWFVDFDPVKAKMEGRQPEGMDAETAALFPDKFVESELGLIPEGWAVSNMSKHFNIIMGQSPKGESYNEEGIGVPFFQGRKDFDFRFPNVRVFTSEPKRFANKDDTIISVRAPVGDKNMTAIKCCIGRGLAAIKHKSNSRSFTYYFVSHIESSLINKGSSGTVFSSINKKDLEQTYFIVPSDEVIEAFHKLIDPIDEKILVLTKQIKNLSNIRDTLLPKLLSGELDVSNLDTQDILNDVESELEAS